MEGIFTALLPERCEALIPHLVRKFRACLSTGYFPTIWRLVQVVFIPKSSKNSYRRRTVVRTISLISFLLITMEKLLESYLKEEALNQVPLHSKQHACQNGKSAETALHQLVVQVEKALDKQETALGIFSDIEAAFNNTFYDTLRDALVRHMSNYSIVRWIRATLKGLFVVRKLIAFSMRLATSRVCRGLKI